MKPFITVVGILTLSLFGAQSINAQVTVENIGMGIHTENPIHELHVVDAPGGADNVHLILQSNGANNNASIDLYENTSPAMSLFYHGDDNALYIRDMTTNPDSNRFTFFREGRFRIGDIEDIGTDYPFIAEGNMSNAAIAYIVNRSTGTSADGLYIKLESASAGSNNEYIRFFDDGTNIGAIEGNGLGGITYQSTAADVAECLPRLRPEERMEPGDLVAVVGGKLTKITEGADQVSAISTAPMLLGNHPNDESEVLFEKTALLGQVPVKVRGLVNVGDYVVPSGLNDGVGIAVAPAALTGTQFNQIVGRAWQASEDSDVKTVMVQIGPQTHLQSMQALFRQMSQQIAQLNRANDELHARLALLEAKQQ